MTRWRYLSDDGAGAADGLATDEALMWHYGRGGQRIGRSPAMPATPVALRLYTYRPHCALVGRYQSLDDEVNVDHCAQSGIEVGRRATGGGAIIMGPDQLGVAVTERASTEQVPREQLRTFAGGVVAGLGMLGIETTFRSKNDLEVGGRKIAGLGLYLDPRGAVLFHTSILVDLDIELMLRVLRIPGAKVSDKAVARIGDRVTTVSRELGRDIATGEVRDAIRDGFAAAFTAEMVAGELDDEELRQRDELRHARYGHDRWIRQQSPHRDARGTAVLKTPEGLLRIFVGVHGEVIKSVLVTGDFNALPAGIGRLEAALRWCHADPQKISRIGKECLGNEELGVPSGTISAAVWQAAQRAIQLRNAAHPLRLEGSCFNPGQDVIPT